MAWSKKSKGMAWTGMIIRSQRGVIPEMGKGDQQRGGSQTRIGGREEVFWVVGVKKDAPSGEGSGRGTQQETSSHFAAGSSRAE